MADENFMDQMRREHSPESIAEKQKSAYLKRLTEWDHHIDFFVRKTKEYIRHNWEKRRISGYLYYYDDGSSITYAIDYDVNNYNVSRYALWRSQEELDYFLNGYIEILHKEGITNVKINTKPCTVRHKIPSTGISSLFVKEVTVKAYDSYLVHVDIRW